MIITTALVLCFYLAGTIAAARSRKTGYACAYSFLAGAAAAILIICLFTIR